MTDFRYLCATRMSRFAILAAISFAACTRQTSLGGSTDCDDMTCGTGQLCVPARAAPDDGSIPSRCVEVPYTCQIYDCDSNGGPSCSGCILSLCGCAPGTSCFIVVRGRTLTC